MMIAPQRGFAAKGVGEVVLRVRDLDGMIAFYTEALGLELLRRISDDIAFLRVAPGFGGHTQIVGFFRDRLPSNFRRRQWAGHDPARTTLHYFALEIGPDEYDRALAHFARLGIATDTAVHAWIGAQALFDERFDTGSRSLILFNNPHTVRDEPIASVTNLYWALSKFAKQMNVDNDILLLYLTSHGSNHLLSVHFPELALDNLPDRELKKLLDRAGIKWRIIVISACYSGSFIDTLKDDNSLIITAAAKDKASFGCSSENDFTYFGDAYINHALRLDRSFISAFYRARDAIAEREKAENLVPSEPQIYIGEAIKAKLAAPEQRLAKLPDVAAADAEN